MKRSQFWNGRVLFKGRSGQQGRANWGILGGFGGFGGGGCAQQLRAYPRKGSRHALLKSSQFSSGIPTEKLPFA